MYSDIKLVFTMLKKLDKSAKLCPLFEEPEDDGGAKEPDITKIKSFLNALMSLAAHHLCSNTWSLVPIWGTDR